MKLNAQQLSSHLAKTLAPIYVVSGDETLLTQEAVDMIRTAAIHAGFTERTRIQVDGSDWGKIFFADAQSFSLFATKRLLELDLSSVKQNAANSKLLHEYAEKPAPDTILIIRTNKLDSKTEQTQWFKALDKAGVTLTIWPITLDQLPAWILQRAKKLALNMTKEAAEFLAAQVEGNLLAAAQELEKLRLLNPEGVIDKNVIETAVSDLAHFDIFNLVDSLLAGNAKRSIRILQNLAAEDTEPTLILWAITRELRTLSEIAKQVQQKVSLSSLFPKFRIWEKRQPAVRAFLQRHSIQQCWNLMVEAAQIDLLIKGAEKGNVWMGLEQLALKIAS
jgi:DNA polymerase-3 subunit delta